MAHSATAASAIATTTAFVRARAGVTARTVAERGGSAKSEAGPGGSARPEPQGPAVEGLFPILP